MMILKKCLNQPRQKKEAWEQNKCEYLLSAKMGLFGFKGGSFISFRPRFPAFLFYLSFTSPGRLPTLPACRWPLTSRWPVTCRHPALPPLIRCLHLRTVEVNHTPWERDVEFHTMGLPGCVVWGVREGLEIKGQPECQANSPEQYVTCSTFSQRMLMSKCLSSH